MTFLPGFLVRWMERRERRRRHRELTRLIERWRAGQ